MDWNALKEEAKKMRFNFYHNFDSCFFKGVGYNKRIHFYETGQIDISLMEEDTHISILFSEKRTPDQMLAIMKALQ